MSGNLSSKSHANPTSPACSSDHTTPVGDLIPNPTHKTSSTAPDAAKDQALAAEAWERAAVASKQLQLMVKLDKKGVGLAQVESIVMSIA